MPKNCNQESETCQLTYKGNQCKLLNFELAPENLAFDKCENFPKLLQKFVNCVGLDIFKQIASIAVGNTGASGTEIDPSYAKALQLYNTIGNFVYCGIPYVIRLSIIRTSGEVIFDSQIDDEKVLTNPLQTTRMEFQAATETQWGAQRRASYNYKPEDVVYQLYAAWLAGANLSAGYSDDEVVNPCDKRTEVIGIRFLVQVDSCNNFVPAANAKPNLTGVSE